MGSTIWGATTGIAFTEVNYLTEYGHRIAYALSGSGLLGAIFWGLDETLSEAERASQFET